MGLLSSITGFFSKTDKTVDTGAEIVEKATDGVISGIDKMFYTEEEKHDSAMEVAKMKQKGFETILDFHKQFTHENSEQSKARRQLAIMTFSVFFTLVFILIGLWKFDPAWFQAALQMLQEFKFGHLVMMVAGTYFIPHQLSKVWKSKNVDKK